MTTKEKLELLWKYLFLIVLVFGISQLGKAHHPKMFKSDCGGSRGHDMMWFSDDDCDFKDMNIDVEIEKFGDGDSTVQIIINGETMDLEEFEGKEGNVFIKKMKHPGKSGDRHMKIIKKKISEDK